MVVARGTVCFVVMKARKRRIGQAAVLALVLVSGPQVNAASPVRIAAQVMASTNMSAPVTVVVTNLGGDTLWSRTSHDTRFAMRLPGDERYVLHFQQPHCRSKAVVIDVPRASEQKEGKRTRKLSFAVMLEADPQGQLRYAGPVGHIDLEGTGRVRVEYDYALVKAER